MRAWRCKRRPLRPRPARRDLGERAPLEVDRSLVAHVDDQVLAALRDAGFAEAEVDPLRFRSGSMNELLPDPELFR